MQHPTLLVVLNSILVWALYAAAWREPPLLQKTVYQSCKEKIRHYASLGVHYIQNVAGSRCSLDTFL